MQLVYLQVFAMNGYRLRSCTRYALGGTPLAEAVYCTRQIVAQMKKVERVSKVNVICLTDGEANPISYVEHLSEDRRYYGSEYKYTYLCHGRGKVFFLRDPKTGYTRKISSSAYETTKEIVSFYREITDYNWIGIRICSKSELTRLVREFAFDDIESIDKQWRKERFASIKNKVGFTQSFYMPNQGTGAGTQNLMSNRRMKLQPEQNLLGHSRNTWVLR